MTETCPYLRAISNGMIELQACIHQKIRKARPWCSPAPCECCKIWPPKAGKKEKTDE